MKVALFIPCYIDQFYPEVGVATVKILKKLGIKFDYPIFSNLINPFIGFGYIFLGAFLLWYFKSEYLAWAFQAPPYGMMILVALKHAPTYGMLLIVWIVIVVIITWPRFPKYTLPEFLRGMRALFK